jgi:hypothetical protein
LNKRISNRIKKKLDFAEVEPFKRSNSHDPKLEDFVDMDDTDEVVKENKILRRSFHDDRYRIGCLEVLKDETKTRQKPKKEGMYEGDVESQPLFNRTASELAQRKKSE